jgi:arsenate reductase
MHKIYTLSTCDTSKRILKPLDLASFEVKDIKKVAITPDELDEMKEKAGSYEALFSRKAKNYSLLGLKNKDLSENDYRNLILSDYTFLKRPVILIDDEIFIGNQKNNVAALYKKLSINA